MWIDNCQAMRIHVPFSWYLYVQGKDMQLDIRGQWEYWQTCVEKQNVWPKERLFAVSFVDNTMISTKEGVFWIIRPPRFAIEIENMFIERF